MNLRLVKWLFERRPFWWYLLILGGLCGGLCVFVLDVALNTYFHSYRNPSDGGLYNSASIVLSDMLYNRPLTRTLTPSFVSGCIGGFFMWLSIYTIKRYSQRPHF